MEWLMFAKLLGQSLAQNKHSKMRAAATYATTATLGHHHSQLLHLLESGKPPADISTNLILFKGLNSSN